MKPYVYVLAVSHDDDVENPHCGQFGCGRRISFRSTIVHAENEEDAYRRGQEWADAHPIENVSPHNDYVIDIDAVVRIS